MQQVHVDFFQAATAFAVIAARARSHNVVPHVLAALVARLDMIDCKAAVAPAAVLAGIIIPAEDLPAGQFDPGTGPMDLLFKPYHAGAGEQSRYRPDVAAAVHNETSLSCKNETDGPPCRADVNRLEICVQNKDRLVHGASIMGMIILLFARLHLRPFARASHRAGDQISRSALLAPGSLWVSLIN
jgi:hypothetical protein